MKVFYTCIMQTKQLYDNGGLLTARVTGLSAAIASPDKAPNGALRYTYDEMGRVLTETDEEGRVESYTYDNFGNLLTKTDRNGTVLAYTYNADGKVLSITTQSAADGIEPVTVSFTYNVLGAPVTAAANGQSVSYTYDGFGRVTAETTGDVVKNYAYDNNGNVTSVRITKNGTEIYRMSYTYDALGQVSKATAPDMTRTYTYNANGALASETDGTGTASYSYNAGGLLTGISGAITEQYTYARNGMKTAETAYDGTQKSYVYDGAGRLMSETLGTTSKTYAYDKRGNRVSGVEVIEGAAKSTTYAYDNSNRLTQAVTVHGQVEEETSYFYDNAGNLYSTMTGTLAPATGEKANVSLSGIADDVSLYRWNALGQQVSYTGNGHTASYTYGADGLRTGKTVDGQATQLVNVSGAVVAELGSQTTAYYRANGKILYAKTGTTIRNYTYNGHGDVVRAGSQTYTYDAFGVETNPDETDFNPFRYCGEYTDLCSGLIYLRARYYDPSIGRFISEDSHWNINNMIYGDNNTGVPSISAILQSGNLYAYCTNDPVNRCDPKGKSWDEYDAFLPQWAQESIKNLTAEYYAAGDSLNEYGGYVRDDIHNKAVSIRLQFIDNTYLNYAVKDFNTLGITELNYLDMLGFWDEDITYTQAIYTYAIELQNSSSTKHMVRNSDGSLSKEWLKAVRVLGGTRGTPGNNQAQNRQARSAAQKYNLSKEGQRALHDEITKQGLGYDEIMEAAKGIAEWGGKYVK